MKQKRNDKKEEKDGKLSVKPAVANGKKMIETEKIALGTKGDKKETEKDKKDASDWRNEG